MRSPRQRRSPAPHATAAALIVVALGALAPAAPAQPRALRAAFRVPPPGHAAVELIRVRLTGRAHRRAPRRPQLRFPAARRLAPSVKILYVRRTIRRRRSTTYVFLAVIVNRAAPRARAAQGGGPARPREDPWLRILRSLPPPDPGVYKIRDTVGFLIFLGSPLAAEDYEAGPEYVPAGASAPGVQARGDWLKAQETSDAAARRLGEPIRDLFGDVGRGELVFDQPGRPDGNLDTGHYDDGHSFGWGIRTPSAEDRAMAEIIRALSQHEPAFVVPILESRGRVDLNGNGVVESPPATGETTIDTTVGEPQVSGGGG